MSALQCNCDEFLVAFPLVVWMLVGLFRLEELWSRPEKAPVRGRRLTDWDANGAPMCTDPAPTELSIVRRRGR